VKLEPTWAQVAEDTLEYLAKVWKTVRPNSDIEKFAAMWICLEFFTLHIWRGFVLFVLYLIVFSPNEDAKKPDDKDPV
jgi:hypothetical protein